MLVYQSITPLKSKIDTQNSHHFGYLCSFSGTYGFLWDSLVPFSLVSLGWDFPHSSQKCIAGKMFADLGYCPIYHPLPLLTCSSWLWMAADRGCCKLCWFLAPIPIRPDADAAKRWDCRSPEPVSPGAHIASFQSYLSKCGACRARGGGDRKWIFWFTTRTRSLWRLYLFWLGFYPTPAICAALHDSIGWHRNVFHPKCHCWPPTPSSHKCGSWPHSQHRMLSPSGAWRWAWNVVNGCKMM